MASRSPCRSGRDLPTLSLQISVAGLIGQNSRINKSVARKRLSKASGTSTAASIRLLLTVSHPFLLRIPTRTPSPTAQGILSLTRGLQQPQLHSVRLPHPSPTKASEPPPASLHRLPARYHPHSAE